MKGRDGREDLEVREGLLGFTGNDEVTRRCSGTREPPPLHLKNIPVGRLTNNFFYQLLPLHLYIVKELRDFVCVVFSLTKSVMRKLYVALVTDLGHLQILPLAPTSTWMSRTEVLAWPGPSPTDARSVFPKPSSDLDTCLSKLSKAPQGPQDKGPATSKRPPHDSQPAAPQCSLLLWDAALGTPPPAPPLQLLRV